MTYRVLCCGSNGKGQLGDGTFEDRPNLVPCIFTDGKTILNTIRSRPTQIACGGNHTFILCADGTMYSTGDDSCGQRNVREVTSSQRECAIEYGSNVFSKHAGLLWELVACGWEHTVAICKSKEGYLKFSGGSNLKGETGRSEKSACDRFREAGCLDREYLALKCGMSHNIAQGPNLALSGWGKNGKGQLGIVLDHNALTFEGLDQSRHYLWSVARDTTIILQPPHAIKEFGRKVLTGKSFDQTNKQIIDVLSMWSSVHVTYEEEGEIRIWSDGKNSHGQILNAPVSGALKYAVGSEHGLVLTRDNRVYAWGWGEHGNCGVQDDTASVSFPEPNLLYEGKENVIMIEGGHATSWIVCKVDEESSTTN